MRFEERRLWRQKLAEGDSQHLTALVEGGLDNTTEELFIATKVSYVVTGHTDNGTLHLGRGIEDRRLDGEEILHLIPGLNKDGEDAILLVAWLRSHTKGHLVLNHTSTAGNEILIIKHLEEYLRGDVIGVVTRQDERLPIEDLTEIHPQEVSTYYIII